MTLYELDYLERVTQPSRISRMVTQVCRTSQNYAHVSVVSHAFIIILVAFTCPGDVTCTDPASVKAGTDGKITKTLVTTDFEVSLGFEFEIRNYFISF